MKLITFDPGTGSVYQIGAARVAGEAGLLYLFGLGS